MCVLWDDSLARVIALMKLHRPGMRLLDAAAGVGAIVCLIAHKSRPLSPVALPSGGKGCD